MGIDYGRGQTNIDNATGIRYGIFPLSTFGEFFWEGVESIYPFSCPKCGEETRDNGRENRKCSHCGKAFRRDDAWGEEPICNGLADYKVGKKFSAWVDDANDVWFTKSNFLYRGSFASPCAPGAIYVSELLPEKLSASEFDAYCYGPNPEDLSEDLRKKVKLIPFQIGRKKFSLVVAQETQEEECEK